MERSSWASDDRDRAAAWYGLRYPSDKMDADWALPASMRERKSGAANGNFSSTCWAALSDVLRPADVSDRDGRWLSGVKLRRSFPFIERMFADGDKSHRAAPQSWTALPVFSLGVSIFAGRVP